MATAGLSGGASEGDWNKFFGELGGMVICVRGDLARVGARHLCVISENLESNQLLGQLWKAAGSPWGATDSLGWNDTSSCVARERGAFKLAGAAAASAAAAPEFGGLSPEFA